MHRLLASGLLAALGLCMAASSARAVQIDASAFGPGATVESFEGLTPGPNVGTDTQFNGEPYLVPGFDAPYDYTFASGVSWTNQRAWNGTSWLYVVPDFARGDANWDGGSPDEILVATDVVDGTAYLAYNLSAAQAADQGYPGIVFRFATDQLRVGAIITGAAYGFGPGTLRIRAFDAQGQLLEEATLPSVHNDLWATNFLGVQSTGGIRSVSFTTDLTGTFSIDNSRGLMTLDRLTFEAAPSVPEPGTAALALLGFAALRRIRARRR